MNDFLTKANALEAASDYCAGWRRTDRALLKTSLYTYNFSVLALASGATSQGFLQMKADSDFVCSYLSSLTIANNAFDTPDALIQIVDTSTGQAFFSEPTQLQNVTGLQSTPFILPAPRILAANVNLSIAVTNNTAGARDFYLSFMGKRVFYGGAQ